MRDASAPGWSYGIRRLELIQLLREASAVSEFRDAALVLIGHGSTVNSDSATSVRQHGASLRAKGIFSEVREIFWKETENFEATPGSSAAQTVFFVPMFISEGYFSELVIPRALGFAPTDEGEWPRVRQFEGKKLVYCRAVGTHSAMTTVIRERARQALDTFPFPRRPREKEVSLFIAGHGTEKNLSSRKAIDAQVNLIRDSAEFAQVESVFIEEEPRIGTCVDLAKTKNIVVVPFFMSEGMHVQEDLPEMLGTPRRVVKERLAKGQAPWRNPTERREKLIWYAASVGTDPRIADVVMERVREAQD